MDVGVRASTKKMVRGFKPEDLGPDGARSAAEPGPSTVVQGIASILSKLEAIDAKIDRLQDWADLGEDDKIHPAPDF